jgi:hypothetical protein
VNYSRIDDNIVSPATFFRCARSLCSERDWTVGFKENALDAGRNGLFDIIALQALRQYRDRTGIPARLVVVGMVSNRFTIADPKDAGMLDVVGFDTSAPTIISQFAAGDI